MNDDFNDVPAFVAVVECGGFSSAARRLNLSRSAVGKAVARLEDRLGVRLFHRTTRSQSLTEDGQAFYERCERALGELRAGRAMVDSGRKEARGVLRATMPVLFGRLCVAPVLARLADLHPGLELDLQFSDRVMDLVEDRYDLAIRNGAVGNATGLQARRIAREQMVVFAAPAYLERHGRPTTLADLAQHQAITYARNGSVKAWRFPRADGPMQEVTPSTRMRFDDLGAMADATVAGLGLAWLPCWLVRDRVHSGALVPLLKDLPSLVSDIHALWPETPYLSMRVRVAIDALVAEVPTLSSV